VAGSAPIREGQSEAVNVARLRQLLLERREALLREGDIELPKEAGDDDTARKPDEDAAPLAEMSQIIASKRNRTRTRQLEQIVAALARIEEDPDGIGCCDGCGDEIPIRRLELMPWVRLCIACQELRERDETTAGGRKHITDYD
jgi:DnaK suppressor protein